MAAAVADSAPLAALAALAAAGVQLVAIAWRLLLSVFLVSAAAAAAARRGAAAPPGPVDAAAEGECDPEPDSDLER